MSINLASLANMSDIKLGSSDISKVYVGTTLVWEKYDSSYTTKYVNDPCQQIGLYVDTTQLPFVYYTDKQKQNKASGTFYSFVPTSLGPLYEWYEYLFLEGIPGQVIKQVFSPCSQF
jgi:hypothetical protein